MQQLTRQNVKKTKTATAGPSFLEEKKTSPGGSGVRGDETAVKRESSTRSIPQWLRATSRYCAVIRKGAY